ncbi:MAG: hypothetical protein FWG77_00025 [Treponema sp.]|nr:hypothetical protein [Treponema sp.]
MNEKKPYLKLLLKPHWQNDHISYMDIKFNLEEPKIPGGEEMFAFSLSTVNIPFCEFSGALNINDGKGIIPFHVTETEEGFIKKAKYIVDRDTEGDLSLEYRILPRVQPEGYTSSPYFDFVNEEGGANGAGVTFLPLFNEKTEYDFTIKWDLSEMPAGARGIWCLGEGEISALCTGQEVCFSYYAVGMLKSIEKGNFGFYWFSDPPFPVEVAGEKIRDMFLYMSDFFQDEKEPYKIFTRRNGFKGHGGTAARRSYLFGYGTEQKNDVEDLVALFAHEMVHNWPHLRDEPYGTTTWYSEGMAEFYCIVLTYKAGIFTLEEALRELQKKSDNYYSNPTRSLTNDEAAKIFWTDRRTQRIPYGRGLLYIANVDAQIREASGGKRSVDDVMLEILKIPGGGRESGTNEKWLELVSRELGRDASPEFNDMAAGKLIVPLEGCFGGAFKAVPAMFEPLNRITSHSEPERAEGPELEGYKWELSGKSGAKI